jgi:hypothetical protein
VAADVLYDRAAAAQLVAAAGAVASETTLVLVAQKLRGGARLSSKEFCIEFGAADARAVRDEAEVVVWQLKLKAPTS